MLVTKIEAGKGKRFRVYIDDNFSFALYSKELKQYNIKEDSDITETIMTEIIETLVHKRAKERALYLLERKPFSVHLMEEKLKENDYPIGTISQVVSFLKQYHYLDDEEYVRMYLQTYSDRKSKRQLICELYRKGISKDIIEEVFSTSAYSEEKGFSKQFQRYVRGKDLEDYATRNKVFRYFYGKGFSTSLIEAYMHSDDL